MSAESEIRKTMIEMQSMFERENNIIKSENIMWAIQLEDNRLLIDDISGEVINFEYEYLAQNEIDRERFKDENELPSGAKAVEFPCLTMELK